MTHAFFKALLFLAAGSVIIGMHHEQDMRKMGGLRSTCRSRTGPALIGTLALIGIAGLLGLLLEGRIYRGGARVAHAPGRDVRVLVRAARRVRHRVLQLPPAVHDLPRQERFRDAHAHRDDDHAQDARAHDAHGRAHAHASRRRTMARTSRTKSPWVVTLPLILLAIPSIFIGCFTIGPMLFGDFFGGAICRAAGARRARRTSAEELPRPGCAFVAACASLAPPFWLAFAGFALATWYLYIKRPDLPAEIAEASRALYTLLANKYYFDELYQAVFAARQRRARHGALARRRRRADRRRAGQRLGARGRLAVGRRCAACSPAICTTTPSR